MSDIYPDDVAFEPTFSHEPSAEDAATAAAIRTARGVTKKTPAALAPLPRVSSQEEYNSIPPDSEYYDPEGNLRRKPWQAMDAASYAKVPDGALYSDPDGNIRKKPVYEGIDYTAQTLYDMSINDKERRRALERSYPGMVKENPLGELYVDEDGTLRKPGGGSAKRIAAGVTAAAAPTAFSVLGAIGGTPAGLPGVAAGGLGGGVLGQAFNDLILNLSGVYDRTPVEEAASLGKSGLMGAAGAGVGRGIGAVTGLSGQMAQAGGNAAPKVVANLLGADPEKLATAAELAKQGYRSPPSAWAMEAPYLHKAVEQFDPTFRTQNVLKQDAERLMETKANEVLDALGVQSNFPQGRGSVVNPSAAVSSEEAGAAILAKARADMAAQDSSLAAAAQKAKQDLQAGVQVNSEAFKKNVDALRAAEVANMEAAQKAINAGFDNIQNDVSAAMKAAQVGSNSGELWGNVALKLQGVRNAIVKNFEKRYNRWDDTYGNLVPDSDDLPALADQLLSKLPETFQSKYPDIVKKIADIAGKMDEHGVRTLADDAKPVTLGQLHEMRTILRSRINYYDLTPDVQDGAYKLFSGRVNQIIQAKDGDPLFQEAAKALNDIDAGYGKNMKVFKDKTIQSVVSAVEAGVPADPRILANTILKEGRTDLIDKVRKMVGPNYWNAVKAADLQEMMDMSKSLVPGQVDGRAFARQVLERDRANMLDAVHGPQTARQLRTQAQYIAMLDGKLDIPSQGGDTIVDLIAKARSAADLAKQEAARDPLKTLNKEMASIERDFARQRSALQRTRRDDPLGHLYDPTVGATEAADRILGSEDLIFAAAARFGENSSEFNLLRQVYAQRMLQGTLDPGKRLAKATPEMQRIMFPGISLDEMKTLAKNMDFLVGGGGADPGTSIAAAERVLNPWGSISGAGKLVKPLKVIPGVETAGRALLTQYYKMLTNFSTSPATIQWLARGLNGSQLDREAVRDAIRASMRFGAATGAGAAQAGYQMAPSVDMEPVQRGQVR